MNLENLKYIHVYKSNNEQNNMAKKSYLSPHFPSFSHMGTVIADWATQCFLWILTAVVVKSTIFWNITPCIPLKVNRHFGRTYRFNLQGGVSQAIYLHESW
jgi:hypothetical protein